MPVSQLELAFKATRALLTSGRIRHLFIGGLAVLASGEPRMTLDVDLIVFVAKRRLSAFLGQAAKRGFRVDARRALADAASRGSCSMEYRGVPVDLILASTDFEESAWKRRRRVNLFGQPSVVPSTEDMILLKIIPGRPRDLEDIRALALSAGRGLDRRYLRTWVETLCDRAEDMRMHRQLTDLAIL